MEEVESEDSDDDLEAKDMAAAMAASLASNPEAGPSTCELCLGDPHAVEDCPLVKRLATGAEEKPENKEEEKGDWQEVKVPKVEGNQQGKGTERKAPRPGKGQTAPAGRVLTVRRGSPVNG